MAVFAICTSGLTSWACKTVGFLQGLFNSTLAPYVVIGAVIFIIWRLIKGNM